MVRQRDISSLRRVTVLIACAVCLIVSGCNGERKPEEKSVSVDTSWQPPKSAINPHIYVSEIDQIQYPPQSDTDALQAVVQAGLAQCMKEKGFDLRTDIPGFKYTLTDDLPESALEDVYSYISPENAAKYGTADERWDTGLEAETAEAGLPKGYNEALSGVEGPGEPTGCYSTVKKKVLKNRVELGKLFNQIAGFRLRANDLVEPQRVDLEKKWAACMAQSGLPTYKTIDSIANRPGKTGDDAGWPELNHSSEEIHVATVSGKCMIDTGYLEDYSKLKSQAVHTLINQKPGLITEWQKLHKEQVEHAKKQLAAAGK